MDALSEAAWALTISNRGVPFALDQALGGANRKDADLVLGTAEPKLWLDVKSLHFDDNDPVMRATRLPGTPKPKAEQVREVLLDRAERYYTKKFKKAAQDGSLGKHPVGLLLCLLKCEPLANRARTNFLGGPPEQLRLPYQLVTRAPNLGLVLVHSLTRRANSDILEPAPVVAWVEPQAAAFANLLIV